VLRDAANPALGYVPFRRQLVIDNTSQRSELRTTDYAFYVQDGWQPGARATIQAGVRVDVIRQHDVVMDAPAKRTTAVGPRIGISYLLTADGRNVARATWGRNHANVSEAGDNFLGFTSAGQEDLYDLDRNGVYETSFITPATTSLINKTVDLANYRQPYAAEWTLGYQHQFGGQATVDIGIVRRDYRDNVTRVERNAIYTGGAFVGYRDENFNERPESTSNIWNWPVYTGISVTGTKRSGRVDVIASYTRQFQRLAGTWQPNDVSQLLQPDAFPDDKIGGRGRRDHVIAVGGSGQLPWGLLAATQLTIQSGAWSGPITMQIPANQAVTPATVTLSNGRVVSNPLATRTRFAYATRGEGQMRGQWVPEWNLRVGASFRRGGVVWQPAVDVLNVINTGRSGEMATANMANATFGTLAATRVPPRTLQVAIRMQF
jgi:hypothetical protein